MPKSVDDGRKYDSLVKNLLDFIKNEKIKMKMQMSSNTTFWLDDLNGFLTAKFLVDAHVLEISYDVFSPKYNVHLKEETLRDVERLDFIAEETGKWAYEESIEGFWLILDCVKLWAQENGFSVKEKRLI